MSAAIPIRSRLLARDVFRLGFAGLQSRPARAILSALGIAIGIAAMIAVVGISTSSQARLTSQLVALGTNLLTITPGQSLDGREVPLPPRAVDQVIRIDGVLNASSVAELSDLTVYRNEHIDPRNTNGLAVLTARGNLLSAAGASLSVGTWLHEATGQFPLAVLGNTTAQRLGITTVGSQIILGERQFTVVGILDASVLAPELDTAALISERIATEQFGYTGGATTIYERSTDDAVIQVRELLPSTVSPEAPEAVKVSRPSDALAAKYAADAAFAGLLVGIGSVALLVGGIGVANTMIISVLERRREIGLRRAMGATRAHIRQQFLTEAVLLSTVGGVIGVALGIAVTAIIALSNGWVLSIPPFVATAAIVVTVIIGGASGLYPSIKAARTPPTAALNA